MMKKPDGTEEARHSVHEHQEMTHQIKEIEEMDFGSTGWLTKFKTLSHDINHHVDEEEADIFPVARKVIAKDRAKEMAAEFNQRKSAEKENHAA